MGGRGFTRRRRRLLHVDDHLFALPVAHNRKVNRIALADVLNRFDQVQGVPDAVAVNGDNHVNRPLADRT